MRRGQYRMLMVMPDAFHLSWMGATRRLFHLAGAFQQLGFEVALLSGKMSNAQVQARIDDQFPGLVLRTHHTGAYPRLVDAGPLPRRIWRAYWKARGAEYYASQLSFGWGRALDVGWMCKLLKRSGFNPNLIWGVSAGYLGGAVAAERLARALDLPWVLELHDPPRGAGLGLDRQVVKTRFSELLHDAACIVVTTASYGDALSRAHCLDRKKVHTIHLSYEGRYFPSDHTTTKSDLFTVVYAGSLDSGRSLNSLINEIAHAFNQCPDMRHSFRFLLAGRGVGFKEVEQLASEMGIAKNITLQGVISSDEVDILLKRADVVVVVQENQSAMQIPGKVFESLKAGKAVLGMMPGNCEAANILVQAGLGFIHERNDVDGLRETLIQLWSAWREKRSVIQPKAAVIREFSTTRLPEKITCALEGIADVPESPAGLMLYHEDEAGHNI